MKPSLTQDYIRICFETYGWFTGHYAYYDWIKIEQCAIANTIPTANAGENISITSETASTTIIQGTASDEDPGDILRYRWISGETALIDWTPVPSNGSCILDLSTVSLGIGQHTLTLKVNDGQNPVTDDMILTIENSATTAAVTGGPGTYEIYSIITLSGEASDFDGDLLTYKWAEGDLILCEGQIQPPAGGDPVPLSDCIIDNLTLGSHTITLSVNDVVNAEVTTDITITIVDQTAPTLAPVVNKSILWPPNHDMVDIAITANASDNSGSVTVTADIASNEPIEGTGDGDTSPDWIEPVIDNDVISFQLRAERSGTGDGRVYTIVITATDDSGNTSTAEVEVIVPHNKGKK